MTHELNYDDIHAIEEKARRLRAEAMANGLKAVGAWLRRGWGAVHAHA